MMKKFLSTLLVGIMVGTLLLGTSDCVVKANVEPIIVEESELVEEDSSSVTIESMLRGIYLKSGSSTITEYGSGKISAGGSTTGQTIVSKIAIYVRVQRLLDGRWASYTSWSASKNNAAFISTSKIISVEKGYYYRVYCSHTAGSDTSGSYTDGIYID